EPDEQAGAGQSTATGVVSDVAYLGSQTRFVVRLGGGGGRGGARENRATPSPPGWFPTSPTSARRRASWCAWTWAANWSWPGRTSNTRRGRPWLSAGGGAASCVYG